MEETNNSLKNVIEGRILIGIAFITATIILIGWIAINENARMKSFTARSEARSVEQGARLFENNCASCHGPDGLGLVGVAPALNSPHFFGYDFFGELDNQILVAQSQLDSSADPAEREELQTRIAGLEAERLALEEKILYDYSNEVAAIDAEIAALDAEITSTLTGVPSGDRLAAVISQREASELAPLSAECADLTTRGAAVSESDEATEAETPEECEPLTGVATVATTAAEAETDEAEATATAEPNEPTEGESGLTVESILAKYPNLTGAEAERLIEINAAITAFDAEIKPYRTLSGQRTALVDERGQYQAVNDAQSQIETARLELAEIEAQIVALGEVEEGQTDPNATEREALETQAREIRSGLDTTDIARADAYAALVEAGAIQAYDPNEPGRVEQLGWAGSLSNLVEGTLKGGRPTSVSYWPQPMPAWSQDAGGPLRNDQIDNLVDYVLNYDREFTIEDLRAVRQFAIEPSAGGGGDSANAINSTNVTAIRQEITDGLAAGTYTAGDATAGQAIFSSSGCAGCHGAQNGTGPALVGLWTRANTNQDGRWEGSGQENGEGYLVHSIIVPNDYIVSGFASGVMPQAFNEQLSYQNLIDLLAYLETQE